MGEVWGRGGGEGNVESGYKREKDTVASSRYLYPQFSIRRGKTWLCSLQAWVGYSFVSSRNMVPLRCKEGRRERGREGGREGGKEGEREGRRERGREREREGI